MKIIQPFLLAALFPVLVFADPIKIEVSAGKHDRPAGTIVSAEIDGLPDGVSAVTIEPNQTLGQVERAAKKTRIHWLLSDPMKAGEIQRFTILPAKTQGTMGANETDEAITLRDGTREILKFIKKPTADAAKNDPIFTRTGYIHPLFSPAGKEITADYPADHVHQHALFFAWTKTTFEGRKTEFWNQNLEAGRVSYKKTGTLITDGAVFAEFSATNLCEDLTAPDGPKPVLHETWKVRAWRMPDGKTNLIDIEIEQRCATESPLTIEKYRYGGMAIRGNTQWFNPDKTITPPSHFLTDSGKAREDGNHTKPEWVSLHGPLDGGHGAVTIFAHPDNFRHPQHVRLHPVKPYFVFAPMVKKSFKITPDKPYRVKYRYLVQDSEPDPKQLETVRLNFVEPPVAKQIR